MQIDIQVTGIHEAIAKLQSIANKAKNLAPVHRHIGNILQNAIEESFEREASPFGAKWKPTSVRSIHSSYDKKTHTKKGRQTKAFQRYASGKKTLTDKGTLSSSFTVNASRDNVTVGTNLPYAAIHQFGGRAGRKRSVTLPARPFYL